MSSKRILVTGSAGFIGYHVCKKYLNSGCAVVGLDCKSDYYDVTLKQSRENLLSRYDNFQPIDDRIELPGTLKNIMSVHKPDVVIHLAAQAGVRHSIDHPRSYIEANLNGTFELLEALREFPPKHALMASTSSAYGANPKMPYHENDKADHQLSLYAATKKANESMAHSYSHLYNIPITMFRFFTVYGPWGRPDMALFKFTKAIIADEEIDVYNHGEMYRDFTYVEDLTHAIKLLEEHANPNNISDDEYLVENDSLSKVAPYRIVNIGNSKSEKLMDYVEALERHLGKKARKNFMPMQPGDIRSTLADTSLLYNLTGYRPNTSISEGIKAFTDWYKSYYAADKANV